MTAGLARSPQPASCALSFCISPPVLRQRLPFCARPPILRQTSRFASAFTPHTRRARAAGPTPSTHCSSSSPCTCSRRGASTSKWRSWTFRRHSFRTAACRKRPLGAGATACPLAGGDARFWPGLLYALQVSEGTPAAPSPVVAYLYGAAVSACQRRSFYAVSNPGPGRESNTWCHASRQGASTRSRPWELAPPPPGAHPPYSDVGAAPEADGVSVVKTRVYVYVHNSSVHGSRTTR